MYIPKYELKSIYARRKSRHLKLKIFLCTTIKIKWKLKAQPLQISIGSTYLDLDLFCKGKNMWSDDVNIYHIVLEKQDRLHFTELEKNGLSQSS